MKKMKVVLLLVVFSLLASLPLAAKGQDDPTGPVSLEWWNISSRKEITESIIADFQAANPDVTITPTFNAVSDHRNLLLTAATSGSMPDMWFIWGGTLGDYFPKNGVSYNLDAYAAANNWNSKYEAAPLSLSTLGGQLAGIPTSTAMIGMFYRKDIFEAAGVSVPTTYAEFEDACATLKAKGYTPLALAGSPGWQLVRLTEMLLEMYAGADMHDKLYAMESNWNSEPVIKVFEKLKEYTEKGYMPEGFISLTGNDAKALIYSGDCVMVPEGPWMESNIKNDGQDKSLYGYFKMPLSDAGNRMSGFVEMIQFSAKLSDAELAAAIKFIEFMYSPASVEKYGALLKQPIPRLDNTIPAESTFTKAMVADLNTYGSFTIADQGPPQEFVNKLFEAQSSVCTGLMTPAEAAAFLEAEAQKL